MQNILDFRSYVYPEQETMSSVWYGISEVSMTVCDVNGIPHEERLECIYTRGLAVELARWIFSRFSLRTDLAAHDSLPGQQLDPWADFYWPYLAHFLHAIQVYKKKYPDATPSRGSNFTLIRSQIDRCVGGRPELEKALTRIKNKSVKSIAPVFPFSPAVRKTPLPFSRA
jgi:hypothetical protein